MIVWRFSQHEALDGRGGLLASARWHSRGKEILYCAPNPATAVLEVLVHSQVREPAALQRHLIIKIDIPEDIEHLDVDESQLPPDWSRQVTVTRTWGDRWLRERQYAVLRVRCVLAPETYNFLINPLHPNAAHIRPIAIFPYSIDSRLTKI